MKKQMIELLKLIEQGAVLSIRRINGSFAIEIEHGHEFVSIEIQRKDFQESSLIQAFERLVEVSNSKLVA